MEIEVSGSKHCFLCKQIDYLPFCCDNCKNWYCGKHRTIEQHNCKVSVPTTYVKQVNQSTPLNSSKNKKDFATYITPCKECGSKEGPAAICRLCNNSFCLKHRHERDHNCTNKTTNNNNNDVNSFICKVTDNCTIS